MSGGPIYPFSIAYDTGGDIYPGYHVGTTNSRTWYGVKCVASLGTSAVLELVFEMPPSSLPSGTGKLRVLSLADATSGTIVLNPGWVSVAVGEDYDTASLNAEGNTTITWSTGNDEELMETKITLDADTLVAGELVVMQVTFDSSSTVAAISTHDFSIIWE